MGEFVEAGGAGGQIEPRRWGPIWIRRLLIKNPGGNPGPPTGGYSGGRSELVEQGLLVASPPGTAGRERTGFNLYACCFQGLFPERRRWWRALNPGAETGGAVFASAGLRHPTLGGGEAQRCDSRRSLRRGRGASNRLPGLQGLLAGGLLPRPLPAPMPGYASELVNGRGSFIDGSTSDSRRCACGALRCLFRPGGSITARELSLSGPSPPRGGRTGCPPQADWP